MDKKRAGHNNPINPLSRVASLSVERGDETRINTELPINVTLNFNRRRDISGTAVSKAGATVTITFNLGIARASLDLEAYLADGVKDGASIRLADVAHMSAIATNTKTKITTSSAFNKKGHASIKIGASASKNIKPKGEANFTFDRTKDSRTKRASSVELNEININGTATGTSASWSIEAANGDFLIGEVFKDAKGKPLRAAKIEKNKLAIGSTIEIICSTKILMQDLIISNMEFTDATGNPINPPDLSEDLTGKVTFSETFKDRLGAGTLRSRIVKELIRRHLKEFGLDTSSAKVEICRAIG